MPYKHPEDARENARRYRKDNKEAIRERKQAYYQANKLRLQRKARITYWSKRGVEYAQPD
jgi:hypothetical protein